MQDYEARREVSANRILIDSLETSRDCHTSLVAAIDLFY